MGNDMSKDMATKQNTDITDRPDFAGTGRGSEDVTMDDLTIPRLSIIQDLSPQKKKGKAEYIPGAEEGLIFNSVTGALYDKPILVIPVYYRKEFLVWKIRKEGGGFRGVFPTKAEAVAEARRLTETTEIQDTSQQFCLYSADNGVSWHEAVISMSKSNASVSRKWNADIRLAECDRFALVYELTPLQKTNDKGDFYIFGLTRQRWATETEYRAGEATYEAILSGTKDIDRSLEETEETAKNGNERPAF